MAGASSLHHHTHENRFRIAATYSVGRFFGTAAKIDTLWNEKQAELEHIIERLTADFYKPGNQRPEKKPRISFSSWRLPGDLVFKLYIQRYYLRIKIDAARGNRAT
jgi:hypothetical protein